jgi:hypothetical protein
MVRVNNVHRTIWGGYEDRVDSFDDDEDCARFIALLKESSGLAEYVKSFLPLQSTFSIKTKPNGRYGVDMGVFKGCHETTEPVATIDIERWSAWNEDWPSFYKHIHFLGRKDKFLNRYDDKPFFMAYFNYSRDKIILVSKESILKYPTEDKYFSHKKVVDRVRVLPMHEGHIFGKNITSTEEELFNVQ